MTAITLKLAATRLTTWATAALPARGVARRADDRPPAAPPTVIGAAVITALRRSASVTRRDLARRLAVARATILGWETGTIPLYCVPYTDLAQLAAALSHDQIPAEDILSELMLAAQCDHLIVGLLRDDEDFADVAPIDENTAEGTASRELLRWAIRGPAPSRFQHVVSARPLLAPSESERISGIARDLAAASGGPRLVAYGQALLLLTVEHDGQGTFSQQTG